MSRITVLSSAFPIISKICMGIKGGVAAGNSGGRMGALPCASGVPDYFTDGGLAGFAGCCSPLYLTKFLHTSRTKFRVSLMGGTS